MDHNPGVLFLLFMASTTYSVTADHLPAPTNIRYEWLDPIVLKVTWAWQRPSDLPKDCQPEFRVEELNGKMTPTKVTENQAQQYFLSDVMKSSALTLSITALCSHLKSSAANITVKTKKRHAELVKNFKCFVDHPRKCTWIPSDPSQRPRILYRYCGKTEETLKECTQSNEEHVCFMNETEETKEVCVVVETDTQMNTLKPERALEVPLLDITVDENNLLLTWKPSPARKVWDFELWYKECNKAKYWTSRGHQAQIPYDPCCIYQFQYRVKSTQYETEVSSSNSSVRTYGSGKCFNAGIVTAIVVPILLFFCVMLSFYCFRRHKDIICPIVPYPSNLLKELMNGTKDPAKPTTLLTPDQEVVDDVRIFLVSNRTCPQSV